VREKGGMMRGRGIGIMVVKRIGGMIGIGGEIMTIEERMIEEEGIQMTGGELLPLTHPPMIPPLLPLLTIIVQNRIEGGEVERGGMDLVGRRGEVGLRRGLDMMIGEESMSKGEVGMMVGEGGMRRGEVGMMKGEVDMMIGEVGMRIGGLGMMVGEVDMRTIVQGMKRREEDMRGMEEGIRIDQGSSMDTGLKSILLVTIIDLLPLHHRSVAMIVGMRGEIGGEVVMEDTVKSGRGEEIGAKREQMLGMK